MQNQEMRRQRLPLFAPKIRQRAQASGKRRSKKTWRKMLSIVIEFEAFLEKNKMKKKPFGPWDQRIVLVSSSHRRYRLPDSVRQCWWWQRWGWGQAWRGRARRRPFLGGSRRRIRCTWLFNKGQFASDSQHVDVVHYSQSVLIRKFHSLEYQQMCSVHILATKHTKIYISINLRKFTGLFVLYTK